MIQACNQDFLRGGAILRGETDKTICQRRKSGLGEMQVAWDCISSILKNWEFLKLLVFKSVFFLIEYFISQFFWN